jgi:hypothetical protein
LREEWGFKGAVISDYSDHQNYMNGDQMLRAGGDLWMDGYTSNGSFMNSTESIAFVTALRTAAKHILYMGLNTAAVADKYDPASDGVQIVAGSQSNFDWKWILIASDGVIACLCVVLVVIALRKKDRLPDGNANSPDSGNAGGNAQSNTK